MSRQDLGEYLGLALETVSRLFSRFQEEKLITVQGRNVTLLDVERLKKISGNFVPSQNAGG
jgi:CRP/FNR family transcriptional regulator